MVPVPRGNAWGDAGLEPDMLFRAGKRRDAEAVPAAAGALRLEAFAATHAGKRVLNEDAFVCLLPPETPEWMLGLFAVADGMGGRQNGNVAATMAVRAARDSLRAVRQIASPAAVSDLLRKAFANANSAVSRAAASDSALDGMGTALTVGIACERHLTIAGVGDSRAYLYRCRALDMLTQDDWFHVPADPSMGTPEDVAGQMVTVVDRAIGWGDDPGPRITECVLAPDDLLLFCTDGLSGAVPERQIAGILRKGWGNPEACVSRLIERAVREPDADNTTVILAKVVAHVAD